MTLDDWLGSGSSSDLHFHLSGLSDRKLHLLTAAFLRRVWDDLPSHQTRAAVEATEQFADGRISARELNRARAIDLLDTCEGLWLGEASELEEQMIGLGWYCCPLCDEIATEYECRAVSTGAGFVGVEDGVKNPTWIAVRAALHAREIALWRTDPDSQAAAERDEARAQYDLFREIVGPGRSPDWSRWRTSDVLALARGIHRDRAFDRLPILADALQDAGCDDESVLNHCREGKDHVRGCWVVDLAMGIG